MARVTTIPATISRFTAAPINEKKKRRTAAYARVSTDSEEQLTSYTAQVDYYTNYIRGRDDWEFVGVYTDMKTPSLIQFNDLRRLAGRGGKLRGQGIRYNKLRKLKKA